MAASTDFDYTTLLSLERAKIRKRGRLNFLGSRELTIDYPKISPAQKEECVEWLEDNRLSLTNPDINFKTLTGVWKCVDISYSDDSEVLRQRFKIDSKLGGYTTAGSGTGVTAQISASSTVEKTYFWRVVDPSAITLPAAPETGVVWDMSALDNGDGTYDVVVTKRDGSDNELSSTSYQETYLVKEWTLSYKNVAEIDAQTWMASGDNTYFTPVGTPPNQTVPVGYTLTITNRPNDDGLYDAQVVIREAKTSISSGSIDYPSDWGFDRPSFIEVGYNYTLTAVDTRLGNLPLTTQNSPSISINEFGLYSYTVHMQ